MQQAQWVDRKFDFTFRPDLFPVIVERLRGVPARLDEFVRSISSKMLTTKRGDAWSIQEHIGHLLDLEELHAGRIDDYVMGAPRLRAADIKNQRTIDAGYNEKRIGDILAGFRQARMHLIDRLERVPDDIIIRVSLHPRLQQPMRLVDLAFFIAEHDDHHIARMRELSKEPSNQTR